MVREPGYRLHKSTGQAYVNLGGKMFYLGSHGSQESLDRYARLKSEWLLNRQLPSLQSNRPKVTMAEMCLSYLEYALGYYGAGTEYCNLKLAVRPISELYATLPVTEFGPLQFKTVRNWWVSRETGKTGKTCSRGYVNRQCKRLLRVIKWAVGEGTVPSGVYETLRCIAPLKRGRTEAPETEPIKPVEQEVVDATLPFLTPILSDMVRFQLATGCRPGELVKITPTMVNRSAEVWTITLAAHKTAWRGRSRTIYVGPKAQSILVKYLVRESNEACFSPSESETQRRAEVHTRRTTPPSCGNRPGSNRVARKPKKAPGTSYTSHSYARAIFYACCRAFPAPKGLDKKGKKEWQRQHAWAPNQLRHSAATHIRQMYGLEAAQVLLGHAELTVTQVYAEKDHAKAILVARQIG
jgi:integrase